MSEEFYFDPLLEELLPPSASPAPQPASPPTRADKAGQELFYWLQTLVTALVCIVLVFTFFGRFTRVVGSSMVPTLVNGEILLVWSLGYQPQQGDIVVLNKTTADFLGGDAIVKRVIAGEGQTVDIDYDAGVIYVDGQPLDEEYLNGDMHAPGSFHMQETHFEIPAGSVFVMGDNRNESSDSRDLRLGAVDRRYVLGRAVLILFPFGSAGLI